MRRGAIVGTVAAVVGSLAVGQAPAVLGAVACPSAIDPATFASADDLLAGNQVMADLGPRPTASDAHEAFIAWIEQQVDAIDGVSRRSLDDTIERQLETSASLSVDGVDIPIAGPVPYTQPAPDGVTAPVVYVPTGTSLTDVDVAGRIVLRDAAPGVIPFAAFGAVAYYIHDPDLSLDYAGNYERDWIGAAARIADLEAAAAGGAAGVLFAHGLPRDQVAGQYAPYPGSRFGVPALYLGADEGTALRSRVEAGEAVTATLRLAADVQPAPTRTVVATLPGQSDERIVVQSHTDGMNAVWDNGPIAMLALASHFAALPVECRPRTMEFVFTTAHLHLTHSGAERYAEVLDSEYDDGTVAFVVALEHLGAREFVASPRGDGGPGRRLDPSGESEMFATFVSESPALVGALVDQVVEHDLRRTVVLRGADAPAARFPPHQSYGGEGGPYRAHLVPTVAAITGPWTLFNPAFGLDELVDPALMQRQAIAFGDLIHQVDDVPRAVLAGADTLYRQGRSLLGSEPVPVPPAPAVPAPAAALPSLNASLFCALASQSQR